jgi:hypothetical protein
MTTGGSVLRRAEILSSSPKYPTRLWSPYSLLFSTLQGLYLPRQKGLNVKVTTHFHLVPRMEQTGLYFHSHKPLHDVHGENFIILFVKKIISALMKTVDVDNGSWRIRRCG